jgi:hypothetical protein
MKISLLDYILYFATNVFKKGEYSCCIVMGRTLNLLNYCNDLEEQFTGMNHKKCRSITAQGLPFEEPPFAPHAE